MQVTSKLSLLIAITGFTGTAVHAATVAYGFDNLSRQATVTAPGTTASLFTNVELCTVTGGNPGGFCGSFDNFGIPGTNFTFFTVTPNAGLEMNLVSFSFDEKNITAVGPTGFDIFTSADGFTTPILGGSLGASATSFTNHSVALSGPQFQDITGAFTIRISGFGGPSVGEIQGAWLLDNVTLNLTTAPVLATPEPVLWLPTSVLLAAVLGASRRRSRNSGAA